MNLKQLRENSGFKQYKIAEYLSITRQQYRNLENGIYNLSSDKIEKLAEKFRCEPMDILRAWEESRHVKNHNS